MEKTMNGSFLRRIFSCPRFSHDYSRFIRIQTLTQTSSVTSWPMTTARRSSTWQR